MQQAFRMSTVYALLFQSFGMMIPLFDLCETVSRKEVFLW